MDSLSLRQLLDDYKNGGLNAEEALERLRCLPFEDIGFAKVDHHRLLRTGFPEVIYCQGKTPEQIGAISSRILEKGGPGLLATRAGEEAFKAIAGIEPSAQHHPQARLVTVKRDIVPFDGPSVCVVSAGTSDIPVAEEAAITAEMLGLTVDRVFDVGVAGIHRLLAHTGRIRAAGVVIVVAGMEGALASVVGGLAEAPVIAVPTSVGYGAAFGGLAPLLTMLNSCAAGVCVCNIDNGFGAAWMAGRILRSGERYYKNK